MKQHNFVACGCSVL